MSARRERSVLALLVVFALVALLAVPVIAFAEETDDTAAGAAVETEAPVEEEVPVEEAAPVEETAPESAGTSSVTTLSTTTTTKKFLADRTSGSNEVSSEDAEVLVAEGCSDTVGNFGLSAPAVTHNGTTSTTFTWTVTYSGTPEECGSEGVSHISITPCLNAISGNYTKAESSGTYKWENSPAEGAQLVLTFAGDLDSSGTVSTSLKKSTTTVGGSAAGPSCSPPTCESWTLDVDISNSGTGTGTVSDNHGSSTSVDATWTYDSTEKDDVDITASGTNGSTASNTGQANVTFSAHPACDADYSVTFSKSGSTPTDVCPNIDGDQAEVPDGLVVNDDGDCVEPEVEATDLCPNIDGDQAEVPDGMEVNDDGDCVEPEVEATDLCPNIDGDQAEVPEDMTINPETGECEEDDVLGEIIDRDPKPSKPPQKVAPAVQPEVQAGVLPFTGSDLLPFLVLSSLLIAIGAGLTLRSRTEVTE